MAQSSNYKQYARSTRVLTEESGFAGGMFWTGNNIDETHLKTIVNCDYDDTTGYLKTRDSFEPVINSPSVEELKELDIDLTNVELLGVYNICAFKDDDTLTDAGQLYIFAELNYLDSVDTAIWYTELSNGAVGLFQDRGGMWHKCDINLLSGELRNINKSQLLTVYDNCLYGLGSYPTKLSPPNSDGEREHPKTLGLQVYRLNYYEANAEADTSESYSLGQMDYNNYILPRINDVTLLEAYTSGFNAARGNDTFVYTGVPTDNPHIVGVYYTEEVDGQSHPIVSPRSGHTVKVNVITDYEAEEAGAINYLTVFQLTESTDNTAANSIWQIIGEGPFTSTNGVFSFEHQFQKKETTLLFTFYGMTQPPEKPTAYDETAKDFLGPLVVTTNDTRSNLKLKAYNLSSATGSCQWRNRLCIWGAEENNNCLFLSEVDNFYYFPVPNNVAVFDTNVISCIPYKDTLLVFTADKIYRMSENNDGTFTQTVIQNDMPLSKSDAPYLTAIKNMVLFKSGNYFYMIVPKTQSLTDELSIAPIYKNIAGFLNTLDNSVLEVLQLLYPEYLFNEYKLDNSGKPVSIYSAQDTVHIIYNITASVQTKGMASNQTLFFKLFLNYNTNLRAWTLYIEDTSDKTLEVAALTTARQMSFVRIFKNAEPRGGFSIVTQSYTAAPASEFRILLDTGYRTLHSPMQKRFREVQLKLYSASENITEFGTAFLVDGVWRRNYLKLQETLTEENKVSLLPTLDLNTFVTELTMSIDDMGNVVKEQGSDAIDLDEMALSEWTLDFSHFKREAPITVRIPVSGKGFSPRFIFMAPKAVGLTINEINWVYRLMHGR